MRTRAPIFDIYCGGSLLAAVQSSNMFVDCKHFVDMPLKFDAGGFWQSIYSLEIQKTLLKHEKSSKVTYRRPDFKSRGASFVRRFKNVAWRINGFCGAAYLIQAVVNHFYKYFIEKTGNGALAERGHHRGNPAPEREPSESPEPPIRKPTDPLSLKAM